MQSNPKLIALVAAGLTGIGYNANMKLVEYQTTCTKLQAAHELLIGQVDPRMAFTDGEARRTAAQAQANAHAGIGIANSLHIIGLARDKFLTIDGKVTFEPKHYLQAGVLWEELGKNFGVPTVWGGRWKSVDAVHFSCARGGIG